MDGSVVRVGVLGCGTVGASLVALVERQNATIHARTGLSLEIARIAVRDLSRIRPISVESSVFTSEAMAVATDPAIDVIVEVMGGISPARELLLAALGAGKPVITANKALLAAHGSELFAAAEAAGVDVAQTGRRATMEVISLVAKPQQATVVEYGLHPAVMGRFPHSLSVKTTYFDSGPYSVAVSRSPS